MMPRANSVLIWIKLAVDCYGKSRDVGPARVSAEPISSHATMPERVAEAVASPQVPEIAQLLM
jgi:hypothetical protein